MFPARLTEGYHAFLEGRLPEERERYEELARNGQHPEIMVIG
jgi:carbonic anhydrase